MAPKILKRCTICKKFHAAYLVETPTLGKAHLCYDCWKAHYAPHQEAQARQPSKADRPDGPAVEQV